MLRAASRVTSGKLHSLSMRVGYAAVGAMIIVPKTISYCDQAQLQPKMVNVPVVPKAVIEIVEKTWLQKAEDFCASIVKWLRNLYRLGTYIAYAAPAVCVLAPISYATRVSHPIIETWLWDYMIWSAEQLGPTFIKLAQWASTRPDLFPPHLTERLEKLQDGVEVEYPFSYVENTLDESFGKEWRSKMVVDPQPIGSGCVAQVFKGTTLVDTTFTSLPGTASKSKSKRAMLLKNSKGDGSATVESIPAGTKVAIKLIHPHVEKLVLQDMELLGSIGDILDKFARLEIVSVGDMVREFGDNIYKQLDLRVEGHNLKRFIKNFSEDGAWAVFPEPLDGLCHKNVLVETMLDGRPVSEFMKLTGEATDKKIKALKNKLSDLGTRTLVKMIFFDNFIHGDLHPGNILVLFDNGEPKFGFLDCGIVYSTRSEEEHDNLINICKCFIAHNGYKAGTYMVRSAKNYSSSLPDGDKRKTRQILEEHEFCNSMQKIVDDAEHEKYFEHMSEYIDRICNMAFVHNVKLHAEHFHVFMALKVAEGISLAFDKNLDMISTALPMITKAETMRKLGISKFPLPDHLEE